jgi:hypothetical protein
MDLDLLRRRRSIVLTAALTVIAMSGALIGATLKTREQITPQEVLPPSLLILLPSNLPSFRSSSSSFE